MEGNKPKDVMREAYKDGSIDEAGLYLSMRQVSWFSAALLLLFFFVFMAGYFLGHQRSLQNFSSQLDQESFADRIYSSLYALYDKGEEESGDEQSDTEEPDNDFGLQQANATVKEEPAVIVEKTIPVVEPIENKEHYAELAGFGSALTAKNFMQRLQAKNITAHVKKRKSKTAKGKESFWYQVVTDSFNSREQLAALVDRLKREEHLKDVRIVVKS